MLTYLHLWSTGLNALNKKIEANVTVGSDFNMASVLWKKVSDYKESIVRHPLDTNAGTTQYERVMAHSADEPLPSNLEQADTATDADIHLGGEDVSFGLTPGAGSTSYLER